MSPLTASRDSDRNVQRDSPPSRWSMSTSTVPRRKPIQLLVPRKNDECSGIRSSASSAGRPSSRKSVALTRSTLVSPVNARLNSRPPTRPIRPWPVRLRLTASTTCAPSRHCCDHGRDRGRRVLQVGVDDHHRVAGRVLEPGQHGRLLAEVAGQLDAADPVVGQRVPADPVPGVVGRAVVDQHQLVAQAGRRRAPRRAGRRTGRRPGPRCRSARRPRPAGSSGRLGAEAAAVELRVARLRLTSMRSSSLLVGHPVVVGDRGFDEQLAQRAPAGVAGRCPVEVGDLLGDPVVQVADSCRPSCRPGTALFAATPIAPAGDQRHQRHGRPAAGGRATVQRRARAPPPAALVSPLSRQPWPQTPVPGQRLQVGVERGQGGAEQQGDRGDRGQRRATAGGPDRPAGAVAGPRRQASRASTTRAPSSGSAPISRRCVPSAARCHISGGSQAIEPVRQRGRWRPAAPRPSRCSSAPWAQIE